MKMLERHYDALTKYMPPGTDIPAIEISGAARWFLEESDKAYWDYSEDFPAVVPPFPIVWLEFVPPRTINEGGRMTDIPRLLDAMGCMATSLPVKAEHGQTVIEQDAIGMLVGDAARSAGIQVNPVDSSDESAKRITEALRAGHSAKWIVIFKLYIESRKEIKDLYTCAAYLDGDGRIIPGLHRFMVGNSVAGQMASSLKKIGSEMFPFLFALSLMHAKNVSLEDAPSLAPALARKREKRNRQVVQFKTLVVHPMRQAAKAETREGSSSAKQAMHLCRGHFKDFREGKGLFGKFKGLYWWDMHVRGDREQGQIIKDYAVVSPA